MEERKTGVEDEWGTRRAIERGEGMLGEDSRTFSWGGSILKMRVEHEFGGGFRKGPSAINFERLEATNFIIFAPKEKNRIKEKYLDSACQGDLEWVPPPFEGHPDYPPPSPHRLIRCSSCCGCCCYCFKKECFWRVGRDASNFALYKSVSWLGIVARDARSTKRTKAFLKRLHKEPI